MSLRDPNVANPKRKKKIAIVIANPAISTTTGWPVGFWWSELSHSYIVFDEAGYEVQIFSPNGGKCEADAMSDPRDASGYSATDLISMGFLSTPSLATLVADTKPVSRLDVELFDAIVVAGGQAPMFTFEWAHELQAVFVRFFESGKIACALCHGPCGLVVRIPVRRKELLSSLCRTPRVLVRRSAAPRVTIRHGHRIRAHLETTIIWHSARWNSLCMNSNG